MDTIFDFLIDFIRARRFVRSICLTHWKCGYFDNKKKSLILFTQPVFEYVARHSQDQLVSSDFYDSIFREKSQGNLFQSHQMKIFFLCMRPWLFHGSLERCLIKMSLQMIVFFTLLLWNFRQPFWMEFSHNNVKRNRICNNLL